jgi:lysine 2,3-aminomutase
MSIKQMQLNEIRDLNCYNFQENTDVSIDSSPTFFSASVSDLLNELRNADSNVYDILLVSDTLQHARKQLLDYFDKKENDMFDYLSDSESYKLNVTEKTIAKECIRFFKNILRTENERVTGFSTLQSLRNVIQTKGAMHVMEPEGFLYEVIHLLKGCNCNGFQFADAAEDSYLQSYSSGHEIRLNQYVCSIQNYFDRYCKGTDLNLSYRHLLVKNKILDYFNACEKSWDDFQWQLEHLFTSKDMLLSIVKLSEAEIAGLEIAEKEKIPVQITPYYLSLFNPEGRDETDSAIRAQVLPSVSYCLSLIYNREHENDMDYMGEYYTSPVKGITRRYPQVVILKPFDSCPQICVYCQRNWEIKSISDVVINESQLDKGIQWIDNHREITEVLITGGDPLTLPNSKIEQIVKRLSAIDHIERIRIATRTIVTAPFRIDDGFVNILKNYHKPGIRDIVIMTHVEHSTELTGDVVVAVQKIRNCGISVYNQQVFTYYNSKKFESSFLRKNLKLCGIDPYYTFNTKGKNETADFRVPIARLMQEVKEEARLLPGLVRTDEPVFNIPLYGKSHLRSGLDREPIMILADGRRVYRFLTWEAKLKSSVDYLYTDVSIYEYLKRLYNDGEDINQYRTIWYYF